MSELALKLISKCYKTKNPYLDLANCDLRDQQFLTGSEIDIALGKCDHLETLILSSKWFDYDKSERVDSQNTGAPNQLNKLPPAIVHLTKLVTFICCGDFKNRWALTDLSLLSDLVNLRVLDISFNKLTEMKGLNALKNLRYLDLSYNQITEIKWLDTLTSLEILYLSHNHITEIKGLDALASLQVLYLSYNHITEIKGLDKLTELDRLGILGNEIQDISPLLMLLQSHKQLLHIVADPLTDKGTINIFENPLVSPPMEIIKQGHEAIINYFGELEKRGIDYLYEAKMLIVGQPRAGKTSLRYKLFDPHAPLPAEDETTRGIDIERLSFDITDKEGNLRKFYYNVWDFGGQQIYQTTHQFFLTHRSLYVLVIDSGKDNDDSNINYWLQAVELLGGNSPLLLVQNEKDGRNINIDIATKKVRFSFLKEEYKIDLNALIQGEKAYNDQRVQNFKVLKEDIETELKRLPLVGFPLPKNWVKIREELQLISPTKPHINLEEYKRICSRHNVMEYTKQLELSRIFHDLGIFLHFQDYGVLENFIVLQNTWATDAVFTVLDNETVKANKGRFTDNDLSGIWQHKGYPAEVHRQLLGLMMQFELCYQVDKSKKGYSYIIPEMLPDSMPEAYSWQPDNDLPLQYRYDFMPKGLLTRLIVRLNKNIYTENNQQWVWKTGVKIDGNLMDCPNTHAEITEAWDNRKLIIRIQGKFSKDLMNKITHEIDELNKEYFRQINGDYQSPKSKWYKMIPCNCITCKNASYKHFYDYNKLLKRMEFGRNDIECEVEPYDKVYISELIDGTFSKTKSITDSGKQPNLKKIFISYSKEDLSLVNTFQKHLTSLQQDGKVAHWYCTALIAGSQWDDEIQKKFDQSDIVCFMVSSNFINTPYIRNYEIKKAFERQVQNPNFKIVPIILDFCTWTTNHNNLGQFTALPYTAKPVVDFSNQNMAWYIITECLRLMIERDLNPTGEDFYTNQALPKDVLKLLERIVAGKADA